MGEFDSIRQELQEALAGIATYVTAVSGTAPSQEELARVLSRYFVKKEICDTIVFERKESEV